ncbi:MAG: hypothetical protein ACI93R_003619 [Flavobacteriales bacterium]
MKIRTVDELDTALDKDLSWRKKEITTLKFLIGGSRDHEKLILKRAAITLMYSHWEGHLKKSAIVYLEYLNHKNLKQSDMTENFSQICIGSEFDKGTKLSSFKSQKKVYEYFQDKNRRFSVVSDKVIKTESNLNTERLITILYQLGLEIESFELRENFIDKIMLSKRNKIAHGEYIEPGIVEDTYRSLEDELLTLIQSFHNLVKNSASNRSYYKPKIEV